MLAFATKTKKGAMFSKGRNVKTLRPFYVLILISFFFENRTKMNKGRKGRNKVKIGVP